MKIVFSTLMLLMLLGGFAQDLPFDGPMRVLTLDECISIALENNIQVKQSMNNLQMARSNRQQAYFNFAPNLNAQVNYRVDDGNNIDPVTGDQVPSTKSSNPVVFSTLPIFNGLSNYNLLNRRIEEYNAAESAVDAQKLTIKAMVLASYLNVIMDRENYKISEQTLRLLEGQYDREKKRESVGVSNMETVLNFKAQAASERLNFVNLTNQYRSDLLSLLQLLQIPEVVGYTIENYNIDTEALTTQVDPYGQVVSDILAYSFDIKMAESNRKAAGYQLSQARGNYYPTISLNAYLSSRYTSNDVNNDYFTQLNSYEAQGAGMTLTIPIFNRMQTKNGVDMAKVNYLNQELNSKQVSLDVNNAIQRTYLDLVSAQTSYTTAMETSDAANQTFEFVKKRFDTGNTDFYTYLESLNNKNRADAQLASSKYSMVLRNQILNLYRGKE